MIVSEKTSDSGRWWSRYQTRGTIFVWFTKSEPQFRNLTHAPPHFHEKQRLQQCWLEQLYSLVPTPKQENREIQVERTLFIFVNVLCQCIQSGRMGVIVLFLRIPAYGYSLQPQITSDKRSSLAKLQCTTTTTLKLSKSDSFVRSANQGVSATLKLFFNINQPQTTWE